MVQVPKKRKSLADKLKRTQRITRLAHPLWKGPTEDGITQSMLSAYFACPYRCYVYWMLGLNTPPRFQHVLEYGHMWHLCEEMVGGGKDWQEPLKEYCLGLTKKYRDQQEEITKWYRVCCVQFPIFLEYWKDHEHTKLRKPYLEEYSFRVPYELPSGRTITLRGKWDMVDKVRGQYWLQENKTKTTIELQDILKQLRYDLQTMTYIFALGQHLGKPQTMGVRYNVVKRPLSGGLGSIRRKKATKNNPAETYDEYYARLGKIIEENKPEFFERIEVTVDQKDVEKFTEQTLFPILENLLDDYEWWENCWDRDGNIFEYTLRSRLFPHHCSRTFRLPYGIYNVIAKGGSTAVDHFLDTGSFLGLVRSDALFPEL